MRKRSTTNVARLNHKAMTMESAGRTESAESARQQNGPQHPRASNCMEMVSLLAVKTGKVSSNSLGRKEKCSSSFSSADGKLSVISGSTQAFSSSHCCLEESSVVTL